MVEDELKALIEELSAELAQALPFAAKRLAELFGLGLGPRVLGAVRRAFSHALHITVHELVHEMAREGLPWLEELHEPDRTFVDEVLARLVERYVSSELRGSLGLKTALVESFEEQLFELRSYEQLRELQMGVGDLEGLYQEFLVFARREGGAREFAKHLLGLRKRYLSGR